MGSIRENLKKVRSQIAEAARGAGRDPGEVQLVAVSKTQPADRVAEAIAAGVDVIGENRVQEARDKRAGLGEAAAGRARWHLIGSLQKNKARLVPGLFNVVESVDSLALAEELSRRIESAGAPPLEVFVQVNTGLETQKGGVSPEEMLALVEKASALPALRVRGLMCIPPLAGAPEESRPHFRLLRELRDGAHRAGFGEVQCLSMGMSKDFELAIAEGATHVRVGTAIFGPRPPVRRA
ncbi:MAG: YggS family pyridoxal phosphate-dependent enzyme [bacterium]|nr:YggS family pyridoxal phosphate-dependent enzyme [bacterium]